jgi:F-type H+-transporting ATPase subunit b
VTLLLAQSAGLGGLFSALGLNVQAFVLDLVAFLVTCYVVGRWVFPPIARALDAKREELEAAAKHEAETQAVLSKAQTAAEATVEAARATAEEIIAAAHADAVAQLEAARAKAEAQTNRMITEGREQISKDIAGARRELKSETAKLVASAAENLLGEKLDGARDSAIIGRSLEVDS